VRLDSLREGVTLALDQIRANKFRSFLTILGIVVGVATVMAMSAVVSGIRSGVTEAMSAAGPNNFIFARFDWNEVRLVNHGRPPWWDNPRVTVEEARRIGELDLVRAAIIDVDINVEIAAGSARVENVNTSANSAGWEEFTVGDFVAGHNFLPEDVRSSRPVIVLSKPLAETLFGPLDPVGRQVRVNGRPFYVIGVFELAGNIFSSMVKHFAVVPYSSAIKHLNINTDMLSVLVVTKPGARQDDAMDQTIGAIRTMRGLRPAEPNNFAVIRQQEMMKTFDKVTGVFFVVMIALSSIGLLVGGVGVIAIMMIAVTERTREIGVRKALGATRREILWQFLVEASTMTVAGAAIGLLAGGAIAFLVNTLSPIPARVPVGAVVAALVMAAIAGIFFGLWPAWRAARMDPVEALRHE
jgi:putative ABC transport system permease protein